MNLIFRILLCIAITSSSHLARAESKSDIFNRQMDLIWTDVTAGTKSHDQAAKEIIGDAKDLEYRIAGLISTIAYTRSVATAEEMRDVDAHVAALDQALVNEANAFNKRHEKSRKAISASIDMIIMLSGLTLGYVGGYRMSYGFQSMRAKSQILGLGGFLGLVSGLTAVNLFSDKITNVISPEMTSEDLNINLDMKD